jgi:hypothetical protein
MAHKGRSWLGAVFRGGKRPGPDFLEAGDGILSALELGSPYTWQLAHRDFLDAERAFYGPSAGTPYPFIFMGLKDYGWLKRAVTDPGTDGAVRWAGAGFNTRKVVVDLTVDPLQPARSERVRVHPWRNAHVPLVFLPDHNHTSILREPTPGLVAMVLDALGVSSGRAYEDWRRRHAAGNQAALKARKAGRWQQFVVHAVDERGDGIDDFFVEVGEIRAGTFRPLRFDVDVHPHRDAPAYRCFHVNLDRLGGGGARAGTLALRLMARSGTELVGYHGYASAAGAATARDDSDWDAIIEFGATIGAEGVRFFFGYTTTLVELKMNREPMPLTGANKVFWFGAFTSAV